MSKSPISDQKNLKNSLVNPSVSGDLSFVFAILLHSKLQNTLSDLPVLEHCLHLTYSHLQNLRYHTGNLVTDCRH